MTVDLNIHQTADTLPADRSNSIPPLNAGDYLTRAEFERRYHAHPEIKKAELVEGIVYMSSPVRADVHGDPHFDVVTWLGTYRIMTYGVRGSDNATLPLGDKNEPQPDALLRLEPFVGGKAWINEEGYLDGSPELIVEIAASSTSYDMNQKKETYIRYGIQEYLVFQMYEQIVAWFTLSNGLYEELRPDQNGIIHSLVFPGLWLNEAAFWDNDMASVMATLQEGLASPEHGAFVAQLKQKL
ncbi:Uma2 family endonuclease [Chloroflexi bacterium TSY]|nr:Uma2 family endonuclease [Chloroflexi bacterium TSY]